MMTNKRQKIIGGMFGLPVAPYQGVGLVTLVREGDTLPRVTKPPFLAEGALFLANASSGIFVLVDLLAPRQVWMPSYLCGVMIEAVNPDIAQLRFYEVNYELAIPSLDWLNDVQAGDLVVLIDYFGFPSDSTCAIEAKKRGAWLCKDASQALLSETVGELWDFVLFSPRKFLGVPDGGILVAKEPLSPPELQSPPAAWWLNAFEASILRRDFDRDYDALRVRSLADGGNRRWFELFRESEAQAPIGPVAMSELSRRLLSHSFDYSAIARRRIRNYELLASHLGEIALWPTLLEGVVPLGFPIVLRERDKVRQALFEHEIYPPVHWPIAGIVPAEFQDSHRLAAELMTIPSDQRYESEEIEWVSQIILNQIRN
jgi:hypothetical protein